MVVVVEPQHLLGLFLFAIIYISIIGKELRGYLIALLFAINYVKRYYNQWNTYRRIDEFLELPRPFGRVFCVPLDITLDI